MHVLGCSKSKLQKEGTGLADTIKLCLVPQLLFTYHLTKWGSTPNLEGACGPFLNSLSDLVLNWLFPNLNSTVKESRWIPQSPIC